MNNINPKKLLNSKWTAVSPVNREKHFLVTKVEFDKSGDVRHCQIKAVLTRRTASVDWRELTNSESWRQGWK